MRQLYKVSYNSIPIILSCMVMYALTFPFASDSIAQDQQDIRSEVMQLKSTINNQSEIHGKEAAFGINALELLIKWKNEAPEDILRDMSHLKSSDFESRIDAIERLGERGIEARGAALQLIQLLGSPRYSQYDLLIYGTSTTEERKKAANALINMEAAGVIALVYATGPVYYKNYPKNVDNNSVKDSFLHRAIVSNKALKDIFSVSTKDPLYPHVYWINLWLNSNPDNSMRSGRSSGFSEYTLEFSLFGLFVFALIVWSAIRRNF